MGSGHIGYNVSNTWSSEINGEVEYYGLNKNMNNVAIPNYHDYDLVYTVSTCDIAETIVPAVSHCVIGDMASYFAPALALLLFE